MRCYIFYDQRCLSNCRARTHSFGPERSGKENPPQEGRSHRTNGRQDWVRTSAPAPESFEITRCRYAREVERVLFCQKMTGAHQIQWCNHRGFERLKRLVVVLFVSPLDQTGEALCCILAMAGNTGGVHLEEVEIDHIRILHFCCMGQHPR